MACRSTPSGSRINITLVLLPPYCPELNPVERIWLYLKERFLSLRIFESTEEIIEACCQRLEQARQRTPQDQIPLQLPLDHRGQFICSVVSYVLN